MLNHWLQPLDRTAFSHPIFAAPHLFGNRISVNYEEIGSLADVRLALVGIEARQADLVRAQLYRLAGFHCPIADLGNLRKPSVAVAQPVVAELLAAKILPILIGGSHEFTVAQYFGYQAIEGFINVVLVDSRLDYIPNLVDFNPDAACFLNAILHEKKQRLSQCSLIGYQTHFANSNAFAYFAERQFDAMRLGLARRLLEEVEPLMRDADMLSVDVSAVRLSDFPDAAQGSPSGFHLEELCKIVHYAGMSDKLTSVGFYGLDDVEKAAADPRQTSAQAMAQMVWYFIHGYENRVQDFPIRADGLTEFIVNFKEGNYRLTFWKSNRSNRWWMQIPTESKAQERHRLVPCSYQDYLLACKGELSDRLTNAYHRFA